MSKTENVELTVLCLIEDGDKILLQNRVKKDWRGYALPGGHVEPGESFVDAVIREMKEETGLTILNPRLVGVKQFPLENGRYVVLLFKATQWSGDLISSEEGQMEWIKYSDLSVVKTVDDFDDLPEMKPAPKREPAGNAPAKKQAPKQTAKQAPQPERGTYQRNGNGNADLQKTMRNIKY